MSKSYSPLLKAVSYMVPLCCMMLLLTVPVIGQQSKNSHPTGMTPDLFVTTPDSAWLVPAGLTPELRIHGNDMRVGSKDRSLIMLGHTIEGSGEAAEVRLMHSPASPSALSGIGVMSDTEHALVIGLEDGNIVLWKLDPDAARVLARKPVGHDSPLDFRVTGGNIANVRFFWRHQGEQTWHAFGDPASYANLSDWHQSLRFGLLVDGPMGSQADFSDYREAASEQNSSIIMAQ
ncbi:MAG TPA: hypothetical protein VHX63_12570 [Acidobacteriaceae bacterium]|jgi:hypothetical protein|nr:hypothetical protein [Acidobacteriaceae bacterium]